MVYLRYTNSSLQVKMTCGSYKNKNTKDHLNSILIQFLPFYNIQNLPLVPCKNLHLTLSHLFICYLIFKSSFLLAWSKKVWLILWFMVLNTTFNNISVISWRSVLLVEETRVPGENHWLVASHWQTLSHNVVSSTSLHEWVLNSQL